MPSTEGIQKTPGDAPLPQTASEIRDVMARLVRRFREERTIPLAQVTAMGWLERLGPKTASQLAALERVRPQSMAYTVGELATAELVERRKDPSDGRQTLLELTPKGQAAMDAYRQAGETWLAEALGNRLTAAERTEVRRGLELMARLVED